MKRRKVGSSTWTPAPERRGGVAILLSPYSTIQSLIPVHQDLWTPHWIAVQVDIHGVAVTMVNCYAPSDVSARGTFFTSLLEVKFKHRGPLFVGSDFNCTLDDVADRSYDTHNSDHDSKALRLLLKDWDLVDVVEVAAAKAKRRQELENFWRLHNTYYYTISGSTVCSSRLDRWHCSRDHEDWVRHVAQSIPGPASDHNGVTIRIAPPNRVVQKRKACTVYPFPVCGGTR